MVFSSITFLAFFLPLNLAFYYLTKKNWIRNLILIAFSLFFYAWGEPVWIVLLIFSATLDYCLALAISKTDNAVKKKVCLAMSVSLNLMLLIVFKYFGFLLESVNVLFGLSLKYVKFSLPIGISFYTFQTMSYTIDVYRGEVTAQKKYLDFLLFVSLFHQLVAGPIVRYKDIANEISTRNENWSDFSLGVNRFVIGLFKKAFVANIAGEAANNILAMKPEIMSISGSWIGIAFFALQIYFDFSAYSDMAIGLGMMFGFHYKENFNYPYISKSITEFWRRWHISLGSFFRDYVYIPMGGNKKHQLRNIIVVWFLTGLWHGASWNFVLWGLYFAVLLIIEKAFLLKLLNNLPSFISHTYLIITVLVGWVIFYFEDLRLGIEYIKVMFSMNDNPFTDVYTTNILFNNVFFFVFSVLIATPALKNLAIRVKEILYPKSRKLAYMQIIINILIFAFALFHLVGQSYNPFLYFRF